MVFEETPINVSAKAKSKYYDGALDKMSTSRIVWYLVKRHKFGLVVTWAIIITISYLFPPFWDTVGSLFK